jgi:hypothetical protein
VRSARAVARRRWRQVCALVMRVLMTPIIVGRSAGVAGEVTGI